jgi:hypothetical protein
VLSDEEREAIFARLTMDVFDTSKAEKYIRGDINQNPLRNDSEELSNVE